MIQHVITLIILFLIMIINEIVIEGKRIDLESYFWCNARKTREQASIDYEDLIKYRSIIIPSVIFQTFLTILQL